MAGNESDGRSSSFNDGMISAPNSSIPTVNSATILLLARLNLDKNDMLYSRIYQCFIVRLKMANYFILSLKQAYITQCQTVDRETPDVSSSGIRYTLSRDCWMRIAASV